MQRVLSNFYQRLLKVNESQIDLNFSIINTNSASRRQQRRLLQLNETTDTTTYDEIQVSATISNVNKNDVSPQSINDLVSNSDATVVALTRAIERLGFNSLQLIGIENIIVSSSVDVSFSTSMVPSPIDTTTTTVTTNNTHDNSTLISTNTPGKDGDMKEKDDPELKVWQIILIIVIACVVCFIIVCVIICYRAKSKNKDKGQTSNETAKSKSSANENTAMVPRKSPRGVSRKSPKKNKHGVSDATDEEMLPVVMANTNTAGNVATYDDDNGL